MIHSLFAEQVAPRNRVWRWEDLLIDKYNVDQRPAGKQTEKQSDCTLAGLKLALAGVLCRRFMDSDLAYDILSSVQ